MANSNFKKVGRLVVPDGKYTDKNGNEKTSWHEIGVVLATPHHSSICVKLHANGFGEGQFARVFYDEGAEPHFTDVAAATSQPKAIDSVRPADAGGIKPEEIPF